MFLTNTNLLRSVVPSATRQSSLGLNGCRECEESPFLCVRVYLSYPVMGFRVQQSPSCLPSWDPREIVEVDGTFSFPDPLRQYLARLKVSMEVSNKSRDGCSGSDHVL